MFERNDQRRGRRGFFGKLFGGAMALGAGSVLPRELLAETEPESDDVMALAREWEASQQAPSWDMTWVDRVNGQYRMVYDAPEIAEGTVLHQARTIARNYTDVYGTKDPEFSSVMVIRHAAIPMVANDRLWDELELGKTFKLKDPETGKPARRNPFLSTSNPQGAKYSLIWPDGGLDLLIGRGMIALGCNMALFRIVSMVAKKDGIDNRAAREKAVANLVPGVILQPSGVFAVARAEHAGCHYMRAT